jgi:hypothetical protein
MRSAIFEDFKSARTLLIWGNSDELSPLVNALDELAQGHRDSARLDGQIGAEAIDSTGVRITTGTSDAVLCREHPDGIDVELRCSPEKCSDLAELLRPLVRPGAVGHHYIDLTVDQPFQIIVSAGEYPPTLRPE